ncbi:MAG TPA: PQQ-binding-like beta-propeller repeat protein [Vicinamibacterales bacterium]|nr:PQQ-binding-like beta-propeller repeat protein [Vicinamibacterales bacterium]
MRVLTATVAAAALAISIAHAQRKPFVPVTQKMLEHPSPDDWLMYSRTYDAWRFSPLKQITKANVGQLHEVFHKEMGSLPQESIPLAYRGVLYVQFPGNIIQAIDGATGATIWEYKHPTGTASRAKTLSIFGDMVYYTAPDNSIVALDAQTGAVRWSVKTPGNPTAGTIVVDGKVLSGRACGGQGTSCYVLALDAKTGKELWKFYSVAQDSDPEAAKTWVGVPEKDRQASQWGLPGGYDPARHMLFWGISNPMPNTRIVRHKGHFDEVPYTTPADLYSNSTVALNPDTGKLIWYYQHLPADDWDEDYPHERTLIRTAVSPDPKYVKWINPDIKKGQKRDISLSVGEGGGIWALDRQTGQFLWASPFPFDHKNFLISNIDGKTGRVTINKDLIFTGPDQHKIICYWNTRSYWPTAYNPVHNALYVPYLENCLEMTSVDPSKGRDKRGGIIAPGADINTWQGLMKVNASTGEMTPIFKEHAPSNGAVLATAGDLIFWGDLDQVFRAFDANTGKVLWEQKLNGPVANSTITYAVNGKQYIAVLTGVGLNTAGIIDQAGITPNRRYDAIYVFALPDGKSNDTK